MKKREGRRGRGRKGGAPLVVSTDSTTNLQYDEQQDDLQLLFNVAGSRFSLNTGELVFNKEQINKFT